MKSYIRYRLSGFLALSSIVVIMIAIMIKGGSIGLNKWIWLGELTSMFVLIIIGVHIITREVKVTISDVSIIIEVYALFGKIITYEYILDDLEGYKIIYVNYRFNCIRLKPKNGKEKEFAFLTEKKGKEVTPAKEVVEKIKKVIFDYNKVHPVPIKLLPAFSTTRQGLNSIIILFALIIPVGILHYLYFSKIPPFDIILLIGVAIQLIRNRYVNNKMYEQVKKEEEQYKH